MCNFRTRLYIHIASEPGFFPLLSWMFFSPGCSSCGQAGFAIVAFWGCDLKAVYMNRIAADFLNSTSLSSCKVKFQQIFTSEGQICRCPSCGHWETVFPCRACEGGCSPCQHLAWISNKHVAASVPVCSFTDTAYSHLAWAFYSVFQQISPMHQ